MYRMSDEQEIRKLLEELNNRNGIEYNGNLVTIKTGDWVATMYIDTFNKAMEKATNEYKDDNTIESNNTLNNS